MIRKSDIVCNGWVIAILLTISLFGTSLHAQQNKNVLEGVRLFWQADFAQAITCFNSVIESDTLSTDEMFFTYLYLGFCLARSNQPNELVTRAFRHAIRSDPQLKLDAFKIPPDLVSRFNDVRETMIASLYIDSHPSGADFYLYDSRRILQMKGNTPLLIDDLIAGNYDLNIEKKDFHDHTIQFKLEPSAGDTISIFLDPVSKPLYKKWWAWTAGGGLAAAATFAMLMMDSDNSEAVKTETPDLPTPPDRPR